MAAAKTFPAISLAQANAALTQPGSPFEIEERDIRGVRTRVWKNAPPTMREIFLLGRAHGDKTFVVYRDERASYESFARAALAIAAGAATSRNWQRRSRRHRHAQCAGMACRVVRLSARGRRRDLAQCLVDWPRARIWSQRFGRQGRDRRSRAARAAVRAFAQLSGAGARFRQPRERACGASEGRQA